MNKLSSTFILIFLSQIVFSQSKIEDYSLGDKELVVFPFGMDKKITVGTIDKKGKISFEWKQINTSEIENKEMFFSDTYRPLKSICIENSTDGVKEVLSVPAGSIYLWGTTQWIGALTPASSEELMAHLLDEYSVDAVKGSYLKWLYAEEPASYVFNCDSEMYSMSGTVNTSTEYKLELIQGWNMILYTIEEVQKLENMAAFPIKTKVESISKIPSEMKWFLKAF